MRLEGDRKRLNVTQKPWHAVRWVIQHFSAPHEGVVDATVGAGTSGDAALRMGRSFLGFDWCPDAIQGTNSRLAQAAAEIKGTLVRAEAPRVVVTEQEREVVLETLKEAAVTFDDRNPDPEDVRKSCEGLQTMLAKFDSMDMLGAELKREGELQRYMTAAKVFFTYSKPKVVQVITLCACAYNIEHV